MRPTTTDNIANHSLLSSEWTSIELLAISTPDKSHPRLHYQLKKAYIINSIYKHKNGIQLATPNLEDVGRETCKYRVDIA